MSDAKQLLGTVAILSVATALFFGVMYIRLSNRVKELENNNNN